MPEDLTGKTAVITGTCAGITAAAPTSKQARDPALARESWNTTEAMLELR